MGLAFNQFLPSDLGVKGTYNVMEANCQVLEGAPEVGSRLHACQPQGAASTASTMRTTAWT